MTYTPLQVRYISDPWRVLVVSMLLNLTSRDHVRPVLEPLFERWPSAQAMAGANVEQLERVLRPTGLQAQRAVRLVRMSHEFIKMPVLSTFHVGHLPGCGLYAADSFRVFCQGDYRTPVGDRVLAEYVKEKS